MAREPGQLDNTRFFFACGEKATIAEGSRNALYYEMIAFNGVQQQVSDMLGKMDDWRGPMTDPIGARAGRWSSPPSRRAKQVDSGHGGTKVGMAVHRPEGITAKGELRTQCQQLIDVAPTDREATGPPKPKMVTGVEQYRMGDVNLACSVEGTKAKDP